MLYKNEAFSLNIQFGALPGEQKSEAEDTSMFSIEVAAKKKIKENPWLIARDQHDNDSSPEEALENVYEALLFSEPVLVENFLDEFLEGCSEDYKEGIEYDSHWVYSCDDDHTYYIIAS